MTSSEQTCMDETDPAYVRTENSFPNVSGWYRKFGWGAGIDQALVAGGAP